jgi:hypothetical protein
MGPPILPSLLGGHQGTRNLPEGTQVFVKARLPLALSVRDGAIACRVGTDGEGSGFLRLGSVSVPNSAATGALESNRRGNVVGGHRSIAALSWVRVAVTGF